MEHLKALLLPSTASQRGAALPTDHSRRLQATLSRVARSIKSNFVETLARKANKRTSSQMPPTSTPPPSKRRRSLVTPPTANVLLLSQSSTISSLTSASSTNEAINAVLYGRQDSYQIDDVSHTTALTTWNLGLRCLLVPDVLELNKDDKIVIVLSTTSHLLPLYKGGILQDIGDNYRTILQ